MITITVYYRDGEHEYNYRSTESQARAFAREEVKWEDTKRVVCCELDIDEPGDFA